MHASLDLLAGVVAAAANEPAVNIPSSKSTPISTNIPSAPSTTTNAPTVPVSASPVSLAPSTYCPTNPPSPPSDVTTSTATRPTSTPVKNINNNTPKRTKSRSTSVSTQKRGTKRSADSLNDEIEQGTNPNNSNNQRPSAKTAAEESQDNKKAMRAERNRQSAAASRERKKRHIKELTEKVKYLTDCNTSLQYSLDLQRKKAEETEIRLQQEIASLRHQLSHKATYLAPPPQSHPMTMHHLTHRGPVTY